MNGKQTKTAIKRKSTSESSHHWLRSKLHNSLPKDHTEDIMKSINSGTSKTKIKSQHALTDKTINACLKLKWLIKDL